MENNNENRASYLTFQLGKELFASNVSKIESIIEVPTLTKIPQTPSYMKGIMNLRGTALPVVDTRMKFGMTPTEMTANTCVLVLDINIDGKTVPIGALVDSVQEVLEIDEKEILPLPGIGDKYKTEFIQGVIKSNENFIMLLDMDLIFSFDELEILSDQIKELADSEEIAGVEQSLSETS